MSDIRQSAEQRERATLDLCHPGSLPALRADQARGSGTVTELLPRRGQVEGALESELAHRIPGDPGATATAHPVREFDGGRERKGGAVRDAVQRDIRPPLFGKKFREHLAQQHRGVIAHVEDPRHSGAIECQDHGRNEIVDVGEGVIDRRPLRQSELPRRIPASSRGNSVVSPGP